MKRQLLETFQKLPLADSSLAPCAWQHCQEEGTASDVTLRALVEPDMLVGSVLGIRLLTHSLLCVVETSGFLLPGKHRKASSGPSLFPSLKLSAHITDVGARAAACGP